jgi:hypothetical protein
MAGDHLDAIDVEAVGSSSCAIACPFWNRTGTATRRRSLRVRAPAVRVNGTDNAAALE